MKTISECQTVIDRIQKDFAAKLPKMEEPELIATLAEYVDHTDRIGTKKNPMLLASALQSQGYKTFNDTSEAERKVPALCIIGNFISSNGSPPANLMAWFCEKYAEAHK